MTLMLYGFIAAEQLFLAAFFLRFWRSTRDALFAFFAAGFVLMAVHRVVLGFSVAGGETLAEQTPVFIIRLAAYLLILTGVVVKNLHRRARLR